jgi:hypothetical protein
MTQEEIKLQPHKLVNGIAILLTESEIAEFNQPLSEEELLNQLNSQKQIKINQCKTYLNDTDWQIIAFIERNRTVNEDVAINRPLAASLQTEITACTTLEELNNININFN